MRSPPPGKARKAPAHPLGTGEAGAKRRRQTIYEGTTLAKATCTNLGSEADYTRKRGSCTAREAANFSVMHERIKGTTENRVKPAYGGDKAPMQLLGWHPLFVSYTHQLGKNEILIYETVFRDCPRY